MGWFVAPPCLLVPGEWLQQVELGRAARRNWLPEEIGRLEKVWCSFTSGWVLSPSASTATMTPKCIRAANRDRCAEVSPSAVVLLVALWAGSPSGWRDTWAGWNRSASIPTPGPRKKMKMFGRELMNTPRDVRGRALIACTAVQGVWATKKSGND